MTEKKKISLITLGCPKNEVDTDVLSGVLKEQYAIIDDAEQADIIFINTCGFIEDAKQESIDTILQAGELKKGNPNLQIYVWGCLSERYKDEIKQEFPEVDGFFGVEPFTEMGQTFLGKQFEWQTHYFNQRGLSTPSHTAYLKVSDGCQHQCTFCAIPLFKGKTRSRTIQSLTDEAKALADQGVRELHLVAQDTTSYGLDLGQIGLSDLLESLTQIHGIDWIRILYAHPLHVDERLIQTMAGDPKICHYLDMPLQHASDAMLKAMGRGHNRDMMVELIAMMRQYMPDIVLRTAFILGFPGETADDFDILMDFIQDIRFDRMGAFVYSAEEGTAAFNMGPEVKRKVAEERYNILMAEQQVISEGKNAALEDNVMDVLVDGFDKEQNCYYGRTYGDALDVDQLVWIQGKAHVGKIEKVRINTSSAYDLEGYLDKP